MGTIDALNEKKDEIKMKDIIDKDIHFIKNNLDTCQKYEYHWKLIKKNPERQYRT